MTPSSPRGSSPPRPTTRTRSTGPTHQRRAAEHLRHAAQRAGLRPGTRGRPARQQPLDRALHRTQRQLDPRQGDRDHARRHARRWTQSAHAAALRARADLARQVARGLRQRLDRRLEPVRLLHHPGGGQPDHLRLPRVRMSSPPRTFPHYMQGAGGIFPPRSAYFNIQALLNALRSLDGQPNLYGTTGSHRVRFRPDACRSSTR